MTRTRLLVPLGIVLVLCGLGVAGATTLLRGGDAFVSLTWPVMEFDEGRPADFAVPDRETRYVLCMLADAKSETSPEITVSLDTPDGSPIETEEIEIWGRMMGRSYHRFLVIDPGESDRITLTVDAANSDGYADFALFRYSIDVIDRFTRASRPAWVIGALLVAGGVGALVAGIASARGRGGADLLEFER